MTVRTATAEDVRAVTDVVLTERVARDLAQWDEMRRTFLDDSEVRVSWFRGTGAQFVAASQALYDAGARSFHEIGAPQVEIRAGRALAHAGATVHLRGSLGGVEVDVASHGRLYWRLQRSAAGWRIARLEMLYFRDTIAPTAPIRAIPAEVVAPAAGSRSAYRYLGLMLQAGGHRIDQELPGTDRPDLVERFLSAHRAWLGGTSGH